MRKDNIQLEILGFDPGSELRSLAHNLAESLEFSAPSDSAVKMAVRKGMGAIQASCRIVSKAGVFMAEAVSESPLKALQQLERKITRQLDRWKKSRFSARQPGCGRHPGADD